MFSRRLYGLVFLLMGAIALTFSQASYRIADDHHFYQAFVEALAVGRFDLSIPGFHGSDILAVPVYLITKSPIAQIQFQILAAVFLPLCAYFASRALYRSTEERAVFILTLSMMPFILFVSLRGWTGPAHWDLMLLSIAAAPTIPYVGAVLLALAILTKPFAIALLPLFYVLLPLGWIKKQKMMPIYLTLGLCALYVIAQYLQVGQVLIGSHAELNQFNVWQGPKRIFLNLAHSLQILFSVHNYYYPDPSLTGAGNLMHTSPLLIFIGLLVLLYPGEGEWRSRRKALLLGALIGIGLNALLDHMDHFYMEAGILCIIIAAVPELLQRRLWIPFVLATLHFQWFYFYLEYSDVYSLEKTFFLVPLLVDVLFLLYLLRNRREVYATLRAIL